MKTKKAILLAVVLTLPLAAWAGPNQLTPRHKQGQSVCSWGAVMMRLLHTVLLLTLCAVLSSSMLASQDTQTPKLNAKPLTNGDVVDMLKAGLSQEIVIAKINASACEFDTSPAALKMLKTANIPEAVILAMVQAPPRVKESIDAEVSTPARVDCNHADSVPIFSTPGNAASSGVTVKCGDGITILGRTAGVSWFKMRTADGQVRYISSALVSLQPPADSEKQAAAEKQTAEKKREEIQRAADDLEDCRVRAQNRYDTKMNLVGTLTLTPIQRVYFSNRLKQNLDAELKSCRAQYESRLKAREGE